MTDAADAAPPVGSGSRLKDMVLDYGPIVLIVYLTTSLIVGGVAFVALYFGLGVEGNKGVAATAFAAWVTIKATQIPRLAATAALVPVLVKAKWSPFYRDPDASPEAGSEEEPKPEVPAEG